MMRLIFRNVRPVGRTVEADWCVPGIINACTRRDAGVNETLGVFTRMNTVCNRYGSRDVIQTVFMPHFHILCLATNGIVYLCNQLITLSANQLISQSTSQSVSQKISQEISRDQFRFMHGARFVGFLSPNYASYVLSCWHPTSNGYSKLRKT